MNHVIRLIAIAVAVTITGLTLFVHAADRPQPAAPAPTTATLATRHGDPNATKGHASPQVIDLAAAVRRETR